MIPVNYHHLYYFWVTVKAGSINAAKERLLLAQPTLSLQIRQLEDSLGKKLLRRSRAGIALTPDGEVAFEHCERIFTQGEALMSALSREGPAQPPLLRLGAAKSIPREIVLRILDAVEDCQPGLRTAIFTATHPELQERLKRRALDMAVSDLDLSPGLGQGFNCRLIGSIPVQLVAAPKLRARIELAPANAEELHMLLRPPENPLRKQVEAYLRRRWRAAIAAETEDSDLIRILAIRGKGVAALNALAIKEDLKEGRLAPLRPGLTGIREHVWFTVCGQDEPNSSLRKVLRKLTPGFTIKA